jgi:flagellar hook-basal body complex protein FliE
MAIAPITPAAATSAYQRVQAGPAAMDQGFGGALERAMQGVVDAGHGADAQAVQALAGGGDLTHVVTAVTQAELGLQAATAVRDKVVSAYQSIMQMAI